jgi:hypothetical protein
VHHEIFNVNNKVNYLKNNEQNLWHYNGGIIIYNYKNYNNNKNILQP